MSGATFYAQTKAAWHPEAVRALRAGVPPVPVHVQLILSDLCNQDCGFCAYRMSSGLSNELFGTATTHNPNRKIPRAKALEILEDCAVLGVKAIQFTGGGEPTVHPDHLELFGRAQALGMETALVTNGVRLDPTHPAIRKMTWIRVSVDAGDRENYAALRRVHPRHWDLAWEHIRALGARTDRGVLGVGFVVTPTNYAGIRKAAHLARTAGAQNLRVGAVFSAEGMDYYGAHLVAIRAAIADAEEETGDGFEVINLFERRSGDLQEGAPTDPDCHYQYLTLYIGGDLTVYRCCNTAYTRAGAVGSLVAQRLVDVASKTRVFDARACRFCQFLGQNKVLAELIANPIVPVGVPPTHVNFV